MWNNSYYGNYRQVKFTDIYGDVDTFLTDYKNNGIKPTIADDTAKTLYYLLYSRFGNSVIASSDSNRFKYDLFGTIFSYGPTWEKRLEIQDKLRGLSEEEIIAGSISINNHAYNPGTAPSTQTLDELPAIDQQITNKRRKDKLSGYSLLLSLLETDVTEVFLDKFKKLFLKVVQPELPLWYATELNDDDIVGDE